MEFAPNNVANFESTTLGCEAPPAEVFQFRGID